MYAAIFETESWMGCEKLFYQGESVSEIIRQFGQVQDLSCLVRMGRMEEDRKGQKQIDKLEKLLQKHYSGELKLDDLKNFHFKISIGSFNCASVVEGKEAVAALKAEFDNSNKK